MPSSASAISPPRRRWRRSTRSWVWAFTASRGCGCRVITALGAALMLMGAPEIALWGRQVMLDIPAMALLVWGVWACAKFMRAGRGARSRFRRGAAAGGALYQIQCGLHRPCADAGACCRQGRRILRDRRVLWTGLAAAIGALPAVWLALNFGMANFQSVDDLAGELPRWSLAAWQFYPDLLPQILGWPVLALALAGAGLLLSGRLPAFKSPGAGGWPAWLLLGWIALGYAFFTAIAVREPRHILTVMPPFAILAASALDRLLPRRTSRPGRLSSRRLHAGLERRRMPGAGGDGLRGNRRLRRRPRAAQCGGAVLRLSRRQLHLRSARARGPARHHDPAGG